MYSVYSDHGASRIITKAFSEGSKWKHIHVRDYKEGDVAVYGLARGLLDCVNSARNFVFIDHGYLGAGHYSGYYSVTQNGYQHTGFGEYDESRLVKIRPELAPMRYGGRIVVLPPSRLFAPFVNIDVNKWIEDIEKEIREYTDREIFFREKLSCIPLEDDLKDCHAVVTFNSKAAIQASIMGISVFATEPCCATRISQPLSTLDNPDLNIDREGWLRALSHNQFTLEEMKHGLQMRQIRRENQRT